MVGANEKDFPKTKELTEKDMKSIVDSRNCSTQVFKNTKKLLTSFLPIKKAVHLRLMAKVREQILRQKFEQKHPELAENTYSTVGEDCKILNEIGICLPDSNAQFEESIRTINRSRSLLTFAETSLKYVKQMHLNGQKYYDLLYYLFFDEKVDDRFRLPAADHKKQKPGALTARKIKGYCAKYHVSYCSAYRNLNKAINLYSQVLFGEGNEQEVNMLLDMARIRHGDTIEKRPGSDKPSRGKDDYINHDDSYAFFVDTDGEIHISKIK